MFSPHRSPSYLAGRGLGTVTRGLLYVSLLLLPWTRIEIAPRFALFDVFAALFVLGAIVRIASLPNSLGPLFDRQAVLVLSLVGFWIAALLSGNNTAYPHDYFVEVAIWLFLGALAVSLTVVLTDWQDFEHVLWLFNSTGLIVIGVGVIMVGSSLANVPLPGHWYTSTDKLGGTFRGANQLSCYMALILPCLWDWSGSGTWSRRLLGQCGSAVGIAVMLLTGSRTGAVTAVLVVVYFVLSDGLESWRQLAAGVLTVCATVYFVEKGLPFLESNFWVVSRALGAVRSPEITDQWRVSENWGLGVRLFLRNPFLGHGLGTIAGEYEYEIHSTYLSLLAETGVLGFASFAGLVGCTYASLWRMRRFATDAFVKKMAKGLTVGISLFLLAGTQHHVLRARHFWVAMGMVWAGGMLVRSDAFRRRRAFAGGEGGSVSWDSSLTGLRGIGAQFRGKRPGASITRTLRLAPRRLRFRSGEKIHS